MCILISIYYTVINVLAPTISNVYCYITLHHVLFTYEFLIR